MIDNDILEKMKELNFTDEQIKFVNDEVIRDCLFKNGYKVKCGTPYTVFKQEHGGKTFYKIPIYTKNLDGTQIRSYKDVAFSKCSPVAQNKDKIIIKQFFEDFYLEDGKPYNPHFIIRILDYDYVEQEVKEVRENTQALSHYINELDNNFDDLPF